MSLSCPMPNNFQKAKSLEIYPQIFFGDEAGLTDVSMSMLYTLTDNGASKVVYSAYK